MHYRLECPANRYIFKSRLKCSESTAGSLRQSGSEFQTVGLATEKARVPKVPCQTRGTHSIQYSYPTVISAFNLQFMKITFHHRRSATNYNDNDLSSSSFRRSSASRCRSSSCFRFSSWSRCNSAAFSSSSSRARLCCS